LFRRGKIQEVVQPVAVATSAIIIIGYVTQCALLPTRMMAASLQRIPPSLERAAQLCGAGWFITLRGIVAPMAKRVGGHMVDRLCCLRA
jgi:ABC-type Fe3+ transport system permease subunit